MGIREAIGEISGKEVIDIGDIVKVEVHGRLNEVSKNRMKVGKQILDIDNITKIEKVQDR